VADRTGATGIPAKSRVNWFGVLLSIVLLSVASTGFSGDPAWLFNEATKWLVAGAVALAGIGLLVTAGTRRSR
jgi:hypothetical protein